MIGAFPQDIDARHDPDRRQQSGEEVKRAAGLDLDAIFDYGHYTRYAAEIVGRLDEIA